MQCLYFVLVAAVIAATVANPTADAACRRSVKSPVQTRKETADAACSQHFKVYDRCFVDCTFKHFGILDSEGQYVPSAAADLLSLRLPKLTLQQVTEVTTTCNPAKDKPAADCDYAYVVARCISTELLKTNAVSKSPVNARVKAAETACKQQFKTSNRCFMDCAFKHFGILDSEGQYVQSAAAELVSFEFPELTQQQVAVVTTNCSSANDMPAADCDYAYGVARCYTAMMVKMTGKK